MANIVVGVDGSEVARNALEWAVGQARTTGARLTVVRVHEPVGDPSAAAVGSALAYATPLSGSESVGRGLTTMARERAVAAQRSAQERLENELGKLLAETGASDLDVDVVVIADRHAARVLEDYSRYADLLVVGSRGIGGVRGMLLGSVSRHVTQHSACPVVVIPGPVRTRNHVSHRG